ncbi:enterotoxin A family protein [Proteus myxofaciens]|uniref:Pertussis toxin subunit 1 n=1 Tax=Proteus myxofaciens ATCC 19692 TaxID=1354337 RepID=A0A198FE79_9GAMM|nr:enterotoxin A family protein [Proteus myxofaciens]OAT22576.1 pertussis toxin subunit 1 [Proteus myxofaciens ATCC 19692]
MNKFFSYLFVFIAVISAPPSFANPILPEVVYRVDSRSPNDIFTNGFHTWGSNTELLHHLVGDTSRNHTDGLISTTSSLDAALQIAADTMPIEGDESWLYLIVPNNNFYSVNDSLLNAATNHNISESISNQSLNFYTRFNWQLEYASRGNINSSQIVLAGQLRNVNGRIVSVDNSTRFNVHYIQTSPSINSGYLIPSQSVDNLPVYYFGDYDDEPVGIFFDPDINGCNNLFKKSMECKSVAYSEFKKSVISELNGVLFVSFLNI